VHQRDQLIEGSLIAIAPGDEPLSDLLGRGCHGLTNFQTGMWIIFSTALKFSSVNRAITRCEQKTD
jgi:hypothetical protein